MSILAETERLLIRRMTPEDFDFLFRIFNDPQVMKYYRKTRDAETTRTWMQYSFENEKRHGYGKFIILEKASGNPIGHTGLVRVLIDGIEEVELGYTLDAPYFGRGFATEAARAVMQLAFEKFDLKRVVSAINPKNLPSIEVAKRMGMTWEKSGRAGQLEDSWPCEVYAKHRA